MEKDTRTVDQKLGENGYDDITVFSAPSYDEALIAVTTDGRAVYDYTKMLVYLREQENMTDDQAVEWLEYTTVRALSEAGDKGPIIIHPLE